MQKNRVRVMFEAVLDKFQRDVKTAAKATLEIGDAGEEASRKANFDESTESVNKFEGSLHKLQRTLRTLIVGYLGKKLFDAGRENFEYFADYQKGLAQTFTLLPEITEQGMAEMSENVKKFSKDMKVLPEEVLPALYQAISASVPEEEVFDFLEVARKAAVGGATETSVAVDVLSSVVNAYGREVISAKEVSDLMFTAMRTGKTTFEEMASNMYSVLPAAKSLEVPFENITAALATMTATGTPTAQATTQLGRMFIEFSKEGTRASEIFAEATGRTFKQFIAEGNNLQDALLVMEEVAKRANVEINNLFNSAEAGNAALALTGKGAERFASDLEAMASSAGATEAAFEKMSGTLSFVLEGIRAKIAVFKLNIADRYFPEIQDAIMKVDETLDRLEESGSLDRFAQSIGNIIATIILKFNDWLENIDNVIVAIGRLASFIDSNLSGAIEIVKLFIKAFAVGKIIVFIGTVKEAVIALGLLEKGVWLVNAAMEANPIIWLVTLIILLIRWVYNATDGFANFENMGTKALLAVKLTFLGLVEKIVWGVDVILRGLNLLLGWIPLIGGAFEAASEVSSIALGRLRDEIGNTINELNRLNNIKASPEIDTGELDEYRAKAKEAQGRLRRNLDIERATTKIPRSTTPARIPSSVRGRSSSISRPKTIHDRIREIRERHSPDIDLYGSRARLAEKRDDTRAARENRSLIIETLRRQAADLLSLQQTTAGRDAKIVEAERNKTLLKIEDILDEINEGVSRIVGDFNIPSNFRALTEYQYKVSKATNTLSKRMVFAPNVDMYLTVEDTGERGVAQVRDEIERFTNAIFDDKNNLVAKFMQDVTRN